MSKITMEKLEAKEAGFKKALAGMGDTASVERRAAAKKLRRAQRKRRTMAASIAKNTPKAAAAESES
jgi:hypothetical protein